MSRSIATCAALLLAGALPAAAQQASDVPLPPPPARPPWSGGEGLRLTPALAVGAWSGGTYHESRPLTRLGLEAEWRASRQHAVVAGLGLGLSRRTVPAGAGTEVAERDLGAHAAWAWELLRHLGAPPRATGELLLGGFARTWQNRAAPVTGAGPLAGLRAAVRLGEPLDAGLELVHGLAVARSGAACCQVEGRPKGVTTGLATVGIRSAAARLRVGYRVEWIALEHDTRTSDGLAVLLDLSF